jgi:6-pyruvoyltetrahydropterin/6-carboxytetrahydropterin synthase
MYKLAVRRDFIARHFLIGGDWGPENDPHSHNYVLELRLGGKNLNEHGYLTDIVEIERHLSDSLDRFRERTLNDLPEFEGLNPSLERFARILADSLHERIAVKNIETVEVVLWETDSAWAAYSMGT